MEGLRQKAKAIFKKRQICTGSKKNLQRVEIHKYGKAHAKVNYSTVQQGQLEDAYIPSPLAQSDGSRSADLVLIYIDRSEPSSWEITQESFDDLFTQCGLDPFFLYPMTWGVDGFYRLGKSFMHEHILNKQTRQHGTDLRRHSLPRGNTFGDNDYAGQASANRASTSTEEFRQENDETVFEDPHSFLICIRRSTMLAWTYYPRTKSTRAILISYPQWLVFTALKTEMERQSSLVDHPLFLAFVESIYLTGLVHTNIHNAENVIFRIEDQTKHGPWTESSTYGSAPVIDGDETLAALSRSTSSVVSLLAFHSRRLCIAEQLLEALLGGKADHLMLGHANQESELLSMRQAALLLDSTIETNQVYIRFLQERSKTQLSVLFNLIAQRDANANIELAKDSRTIALASQQDSDAMKTIAIMTMFFLPGTFFAALFATPLLQWNSSKVIQARFWVFWAFTLPVTALVFVLWFGITKRHAIQKRNENKRQRAKINRQTTNWACGRTTGPNYNDSDHDNNPEQSCDDETQPTFRWNASWAQKILRKRSTRLRRDSEFNIEMENPAGQD